MYNSNNGNVGVAPTCNSAYEPNCVKEPRLVWMNESLLVLQDRKKKCVS